MLLFKFVPGTESDVVTNELRKRKEAPAIEPNVQETNDVETISQAITKPEDQETAAATGVSETNDDKDTEPSESVKTHIDKKNE